MIGQANSTAGCGKKWFVVKALVEREVSELTNFATQGLRVLADASRTALSGGRNNSLIYLYHFIHKIMKALESNTVIT